MLQHEKILNSSFSMRVEFQYARLFIEPTYIEPLNIKPANIKPTDINSAVVKPVY